MKFVTATKQFIESNVETFLPAAGKALSEDEMYLFLDGTVHEDIFTGVLGKFDPQELIAKGFVTEEFFQGRNRPWRKKESPKCLG